jgi:hypothetical protein
MSEGRLLALVQRYPDSVALARRFGSPRLFPALAQLERAGLVYRRHRGEYGLTLRGRSELKLQRLLAHLLRAPSC